MANTLYITATEARSGKSAIALGMMRLVTGRVRRPALFRPIINSTDPAHPDHDIDLLLKTFHLDMPYEETYACSLDEALELTNRYAPEHLIIQTADYRQVAEGVVNAGSVFLGPYTTESAGDYASGTNHTLPTNGYAVAYNGVNLDSYHRKITFQELTPQGVRSIGPAVELLAAGEQLDAHRNAMAVRMDSLNLNTK